MKRIILVSGEVCAGKAFYVKKLQSSHELVVLEKIGSSYFGAPPIHIELGDLVREKHATSERIFDNTLDNYLTEKVAEIAKKTTNENIIVTGFRQPSLIKSIANLFHKVEYVYLVCPRHILKDRFENRALIKDLKTTFEQAIEGDNALGMKDLQNYLLTEVECEFINNY